MVSLWQVQISSYILVALRKCVFFKDIQMILVLFWCTFSKSLTITFVCVLIHSPHPVEDLSHENNLENSGISTVEETKTLYYSPFKIYENLINSTGLIILFCMIVLLLPMITLFFHNGDGVKNFTDLFYVVYCCFPVGLPTLYFSLKPKYLSIAMKNVPF